MGNIVSDYEHLRSVCEDRAQKADNSMQIIKRALENDEYLTAYMVIGLVREDLAAILNHTRAMNRQTSDGEDKQ